MDDPDSGFHDDSNPNIEEGDWVNSYRGPGQLLSVFGDMAKVQLISGAQSIVTVPYGALRKISKSEALDASRRLPNVKKELKDILDQMTEYLEITTEDISAGDSRFTGDPKKAYEYMENTLLDMISLKNKDPYSPYYEEFGRIVSRVSLLCDLILDDTDDRDLIKKISILQDKFHEISE